MCMIWFHVWRCSPMIRSPADAGDMNGSSARRPRLSVSCMRRRRRARSWGYYAASRASVSMYSLAPLSSCHCQHPLLPRQGNLRALLLLLPSKPTFPAFDLDCSLCIGFVSTVPWYAWLGYIFFNLLCSQVVCLIAYVIICTYSLNVTSN